MAKSSDWKGRYSFLMATLVPDLESRAELTEGEESEGVRREATGRAADSLTHTHTLGKYTP